MGKKDKFQHQAAAALVMEVIFPADISENDAERIIDEARNYGEVKRATFSRSALLVKEMV